MPGGPDLLELLIHAVRLVREEELRFVDVLDELLDGLVYYYY